MPWKAGVHAEPLIPMMRERVTALPVNDTLTFLVHISAISLDVPDESSFDGHLQ